MISKIFFLIKLIVIFLPFILFQYLNKRANFKKEVRYKQFIIPFVSLFCFGLMFGFISKFYELIAGCSISIEEFLYDTDPSSAWNGIKNFFSGTAGFIALIFISILVLSLFTFIKRVILLFFRGDFDEDTIRGSIISPFYEYDEADSCWYLKKSCVQMRKFVKIAYYIVYILSALIMFESFELFRKDELLAPFCPVLAVIVMGELAFFLDGLTRDEVKGSLVVTKDNSRLVAMYALLRKPLAKLFGDKLASEGTTINVTGQNGGAAEDILANIEKTGGHIGENYVAFMRKKIDGGLSPNVDYLRSGYDLAAGNSLLFNTPFYDKLIPYAFYAVNRSLLSGKKILVVSGRHGTEEDLISWCKKGLLSATNVPDLYKISVLTGEGKDEDAYDIGIISRSGVHDLDIHKANMDFLKKVGFVIVVEPSRLVTTAQIGLNLLIKCCGEDNNITFCSMDRNCDGLVDSLSHILMTNITEVSATEYPHGMSSFMCWKADDEYLQHRLFPGVSRYLGLGTELSFVALKNQVKQAVWYGEDMFPVLDAHWISKQYYYDFLKYANLPTTQESFDKHFKTSFNMCNESVSDYSYVTVEDDRKNLFEARRNFATIAENQGFVNVISSEYMLREYMADNTDIFTADAKAIPYITADYARTKRNSVLSLCLLLCVGNVSEKEIIRKFSLMGIETEDCKTTLWDELCVLFSSCETDEVDKDGCPIITVEYPGRDKKISFEKDLTIIFKREYSIETGKFENMYTIESKDFADILLDDLQNAGYIAEIEGQDYYIGTELKGHVYQKYLPGQLFTLSGKYYEMISTTSDNKILLRRASEHINGRISYRQVRKYILDKIRNSEDMGALKTVNNIEIHYLFADFEVETDGYWKLKSYNDFENGSHVEINAVPVRKYFNKQILKLDFSKIGELFTDSVRKTLTVLLNEVFVTLFAENQPFISAVTAGDCEIPATYSLEIKEETSDFDNCIFIIEDSQLDIGLLVAVERNLDRILQIISDYLLWNKDKIENKAPVTRERAPFVIPQPEVPAAQQEETQAEAQTEQQAEQTEVPAEEPQQEVSQETETETAEPAQAEVPAENVEMPSPVTVQEEKPAKKGIFSKMTGKFKSVFKKKKKETLPEDGEPAIIPEPAVEETAPADVNSQDNAQPETTQAVEEPVQPLPEAETAPEETAPVESEKEAEVVHSE